MGVVRRQVARNSRTWSKEVRRPRRAAVSASERCDRRDCDVLAFSSGTGLIRVPVLYVPALGWIICLVVRIRAYRGFSSGCDNALGGGWDLYGENCVRSEKIRPGSDSGK